MFVHDVLGADCMWEGFRYCHGFIAMTIWALLKLVSVNTFHHSNALCLSQDLRVHLDFKCTTEHLMLIRAKSFIRFTAYSSPT